MDYQPDGKDKELDELVQQKAAAELQRIQRNADRRELRENQKNRRANGGAGSPPAMEAGSPILSDVDSSAAANNGSAELTPQKGRGRNKDGTARKCANCGQVGHIKTNRKSVYTFFCPGCGSAEKIWPGGVVKRDDFGDGKGSVSSAGSPRKGNAATRSFLQDSFSKFEL